MVSFGKLARRGALALALTLGIATPPSDAKVCDLALAEMEAQVDINQLGTSLFVTVDAKVRNVLTGATDSAGTFLRWGLDDTTVQFTALSRTHFITPTHYWLVNTVLCDGFLAYQLL